MIHRFFALTRAAQIHLVVWTLALIGASAWLRDLRGSGEFEQSILAVVLAFGALFGVILSLRHAFFPPVQLLANEQGLMTFFDPQRHVLRAVGETILWRDIESISARESEDLLQIALRPGHNLPLDEISLRPQTADFDAANTLFLKGQTREASGAQLAQQLESLRHESIQNQSAKAAKLN